MHKEYTYLSKTATSKRELEKRIKQLEAQAPAPDPFKLKHVTEPAIGGAILGGGAALLADPIEKLILRLRGIPSRPLEPLRRLLPMTAGRAAGWGLAGAGLGALAGTLGVTNERSFGIPEHNIPYTTTVPVASAIGGAHILGGLSAVQEAARAPGGPLPSRLDAIANLSERIQKPLRDILRTRGKDPAPLGQLFSTKSIAIPAPRTLLRSGVTGAALGAAAGLTGLGVHHLHGKWRRDG